MKKTIIALTSILALGLSNNSTAAELTVDEIVQKANLASYYGGDDGAARATMEITDAQGRTREREFTILRKDKEDGNDQFYYVYFHKPGDVRKTVFMVHKHIDKDDDRWLYLPALDLVKRIGASDKRTSFVGSNFFYEDVSGRRINDDVHELKETTDKHYVLENTPKDADSVEFAKYMLWIEKSSFLPVKAEYYDAEGKIYRRVEALETKEIDGIPTVVKSKVEDLGAGGSTVMDFTKIEYNKGISEDIFSERYLRKPPREFISR